MLPIFDLYQFSVIIGTFLAIVGPASVKMVGRGSCRAKGNSLGKGMAPRERRPTIAPIICEKWYYNTNVIALAITVAAL
jgi:hypothetical protein